MSAEPPTDPEPSDDSGGSDTDTENRADPDAESEASRDGTTGSDERDDQKGADGEVSRAFVLGLLAIGLLLFSLLAWAALTGRGSPL
jgi:hypothetical protein